MTIRDWREKPAVAAGPGKTPTAATMEPIIAIVREPGQRGAKAIMVDGKQWGHIEMFGAGNNGAYYQFRQVNGTWLPDPRGSNRPRKGIYRVWSDGRTRINAVRAAQEVCWRTGQPFPKITVEPIAARLAAAARELVAARVLVSPTIMERNEARKRQERLDRIAQEEKRRRERFKRKIEEAMPGESPDRVNAIVNLMIWANEH